MDKDQKLRAIFENDPLGLLVSKSSATTARNEDERLVDSFQEINEFFEKNGREPEQGAAIQEHQLYSRLKSLRENPVKKQMLNAHDKHDLLKSQVKTITSFEDILNDDALGLLDDDSEGLFDLKHVTTDEQRASSDFVARRKRCKDFNKYEAQFKSVQDDLSKGKRKLITFKEENLAKGDFYVHNGILLFLENVDFEKQIQEYKSGSRLRKDGRTRVIFENGTESNMLYRSLYKALLANGKAVSKNADLLNEEFEKTFGDIKEEDQEAGFIYILKSKSENSKIKDMRNLFKIGFSKTAIEERIKNARHEPTYLMADVRVVMGFKCYNINPQKLEQLLHNFFGNACLNIDVFDEAGNRHTPREWFIAPLEIIEAAVQYIISGEIVNYRYNSDSEKIESK